MNNTQNIVLGIKYFYRKRENILIYIYYLKRFDYFCSLFDKHVFFIIIKLLFNQPMNYHCSSCITEVNSASLFFKILI